jgi:tetratricopeptide (TPR) repeat protein
MKLRTLTCLAVLFLLAQQSFAAASPKELLATGHADEAIQTLQQQVSRSATDAESYNLLCRAYFMIEDWDRGIAACERARNLDPNKSMYSLWLGRVYGEKADHVGFLSAAGLAKKVRVSFERAVELDPKSWEARTDLAEFYMEAPGMVGGGKDKAREQVKEIMALNPAMAHWVLARLAEREKDPATAEREYRAAISASHSSVRSWLDLGNFYFHAHRFDDMEQAFRNMESGSADRPESFMHAADILLRADRDRALAIRLVRRYLSSGTVEEGPAFKAHQVLGQLLEKQGDRQGAAEEYRAALALSHTYARAQQDLKRIEH